MIPPLWERPLGEHRREYEASRGVVRQVVESQVHRARGASRVYRYAASYFPTHTEPARGPVCFWRGECAPSTAEPRHRRGGTRSVLGCAARGASNFHLHCN